MKERNNKVALKNEGGIEFIFHDENGKWITQDFYEEAKGKFAYLFRRISSIEKSQVKKWLEERKDETQEVDDFLSWIQFSLSLNGDCYDQDYEIGKIEFSSQANEEEAFSIIEWAKMCSNYDRERHSSMASYQEVLLWYAYRIINKHWTLRYLSPGKQQDIFIEKIGIRKLKDLEEGQNYMLARYRQDCIAIGAPHKVDEYDYPIIDVYYFENYGKPHEILKQITGVWVSMKP